MVFSVARPTVAPSLCTLRLSPLSGPATISNSIPISSISLHTNKTGQAKGKHAAPAGPFTAREDPIAHGRARSGLMELPPVPRSRKGCASRERRCVGAHGRSHRPTRSISTTRHPTDPRDFAQSRIHNSRWPAGEQDSRSHLVRKTLFPAENTDPWSKGHSRKPFPVPIRIDAPYG